MPVKFTEARIAKMHKEGFGQGRGADYKPWITVTDISSTGRSRRVWSPKTGRTHHLLSDVEHNLFLSLEWSRDVVDIREQFPLDRAATQAIAQQAGIRHPHYPGTNIPTVMTVDFMVTRMRDGEKVFEAFDAKRTEEAQEPRSILKLEIARRFCQHMSYAHHLVFDSLIPKTIVQNINWIRDAELKEGEVEPSRGHWARLTARMAAELTGAQYDRRSVLSEYCEMFDARHGLEPGSGLRTARMLMAERMINVDLHSDAIERSPMQLLEVTARPGRLRAVG